MINDKRNSFARPVELARFGSIGEMSAQTGIPSEILTAAKKNGCTFVRHGRPDLFEFLRWYFSQELSSDEQVNWSRRDKRAGALIKEHKLQVSRREVYKAQKVDGFMGQVVRVAFFGELDRLCKEFPATLKGKQELAIAEECDLQVKRIKQLIVSKFQEWDAMNPEEKE